MQNVEPDQFSLTVKTGDKASENFVIDSQFQSVAKSVGEESTFTLPRGLYSVKVRTANNFSEKHVTLRSNQIVTFDPIPFETSAPLPNTFETSELQTDIASSYSKKKYADVVLGKGSELFLFGSIYRGKHNIELLDKDTGLALGLTLRNDKDEILIDFSQPETGSCSFYDEPWAACDVDVDPGIYCLCLETAKGDVYKQTIVASSGWQTQIFLQPRDYGLDQRDIRADLTSGSIFMARIGMGFDAESTPNNEQSTNFRLTEVAKSGLLEGRNVISEEVWENLYSGTIENPMLGIYAAHLILLNSGKNDSGVQAQDRITNELQKVVSNLRELLGSSHPDVEALALKTGMPVDFEFSVFPMLARSWDLVIEASFQKPEIVPKDSVACHYSEGLWNRDLWLIWGVPVDQSNENILIDQIKFVIQQELSANKIIQNVKNKLTNSGGLKGIIESISNNKYFRGIFGLKETLQSITSNLNDEQILALILKVGMPRARIEGLLKNIRKSEVINASPEMMMQSAAMVNDDPQKGRWGGKSENNGRKMSAEVSGSEIPGLYTATIIVESTNDQSPLSGTVQFYLHDTFLNPDPVIPVKKGKAILTLAGVWGAFTVGAKTDGGEVELELDLTEVENAPKEFKER